MTYQEFVLEVRDRLNEMQAQNENLYFVSADIINKIQNSYYGLLISMRASPDFKYGINLRDYYFQFSYFGGTIDDIAGEIDQRICQEIEHMPHFDLSVLKDYEFVKDHLGLQVINADKNYGLLQTIPYTQIADLAIVYRIFLDDNTSTLVNDNMLNHYGISKEQLHTDATMCVQRKAPCVIQKIGEAMKEILESMISEKEAAEEQTEEEMVIPEIMQKAKFYVARIDGAYGASVIARPDFFTEATQIMGGDFYIIPSSMHEVMLIKDIKEGGVKDFEKMIWQVNTTEVSGEDYLSNRLYHYDSKNQVFEIAADYEQRIKNGPRMSM